MRKKWGFFFLVTALGCLAFGMGATVSAEVTFEPRMDAEEDAAINIVGNMSNFEALEAVIGDFEEYYPNCEVLYTGLTDGSYFDLLETRLMNDDSVGIFMIGSSQYNLSTVLQEAAADLQQEDIDFSDIKQETLDSCISDGVLYEIPLAHTAVGLIVNTSLLEQEGLSVPQNYEEFLSVCGTLKEQGYTPIQGWTDTAAYYLIRSMVFVQLSKEYSTAEAMETLASGADGCVDSLRPALEILAEIYENGYMDQEVNSTYEDGYNDAILKFFEGDVPFLAGTTETYSGMAKRESKSEHYSAEPFDYEFIPTPLAEDGAYSYIENWWGFAVNQNCSDKDWAVEFMRFLVTKAEINQLASVKGLPSVAAEQEDGRFESLYAVSEENCYTNDSFFPASVDKAVTKAEGMLVDGEVDVDGALDAIEEFLQDPTKLEE